jgi:hypothetical protein
LAYFRVQVSVDILLAPRWVHTPSHLPSLPVIQANAKLFVIGIAVGEKVVVAHG